MKKWVGIGMAILLGVGVWGFTARVWRGGAVSRKISVTKTILSSLDAALERFRIDFGVYPTIGDASQGPVKNSEAEWVIISKALAAKSWVDPGTPGAEELTTVLTSVLAPMDKGKKRDWNALRTSWTGPYVKARNGVVKDGYHGNAFRLVVDNQQGAYKLYAAGKNGLDENGLGDDEVSEGSQLVFPAPSPGDLNK